MARRRRSVLPDTATIFVALGALLLIVGAGVRDVQSQVSIGLAIGGYNGTVTGDAPKDAGYNGKSGLAGAVILEYRLKPDVAFSFQPGITQKGTVIAFDIPGSDEKRDSIDIAVDYISLPLIARVIGSGGRWYVTGGAEVGLVSSATGTLVEGGDDEVDLSEAIESVDFGAVFGIGTFIPVGPLRTFIEVRWTQGLLNIGTDEGTNTRIRNTGRHLLFGILHNFGS